MADPGIMKATGRGRSRAYTDRFVSEGVSEAEGNGRHPQVNQHLATGPSELSPARRKGTEGTRKGPDPAPSRPCLYYDYEAFVYNDYFMRPLGRLL